MNAANNMSISKKVVWFVIYFSIAMVVIYADILSIGLIFENTYFKGGAHIVALLFVLFLALNLDKEKMAKIVGTGPRAAFVGSLYGLCAGITLAILIAGFLINSFGLIAPFIWGECNA